VAYPRYIRLTSFCISWIFCAFDVAPVAIPLHCEPCLLKGFGDTEEWLWFVLLDMKDAPVGCCYYNTLLLLFNMFRLVEELDVALHVYYPAPPSSVFLGMELFPPQLLWKARLQPRRLVGRSIVIGYALFCYYVLSYC